MTRRHSNGAASFARRSGSRPRSTFLASGGSASGCSTVPRCTTADDTFTSGKTAIGTGTGGAAGRASQTAAANRALATGRAFMSRVLTLFFAAVFVATACGQTPTTPSASASGAASATAAAITRGGTVIVAIWQEPSTLAAHYQNQTV